jgi:microcystin-dependent protein
MVIISPTNPIRFDNSLDYGFGINADPLCYRQKFELADFTRLQVRSDDEEVYLIIREAFTGKLIDTLTFSEIPSLLVDQTFKIFELDVIFSGLGVGEYVFSIDDNSSSIISVKTKHENTLLFRYQNSENNFGIVFDTGIQFYLRVEGTIQNYTPKSDDVIYTDQLKNATKLFGLPYNVFTLFVGSPRGVDDFMLDLVNRLSSCDMIQINGIWYEKTEGAEWEVERVDNYAWGVMSTEIMPAQNTMLERLAVDETLNEDEYMIIQRYSNNFMNNSEATITIEDTFYKNVVLNYIAVYRKSIPYTLKVGITPGGNEVAEVLIENLVHTVNIMHKFSDLQTLYLSGMTGESDISVVWDRVDKIFKPNMGETLPAETLGKGATIMWQGTVEDLEIQFNLVSGAARLGSDWVGWCISDGQNATINMSGKVALGWKYEDSKYGVIGTLGGSETHTLTTDELPNFHLKMFGNDYVNADVVADLNANSIVSKATTTSGSKAEKYAMRQSQNIPLPAQPTLGKTSSIGSEVPHNIMQPYAVIVYITKIS